MEKTHSLYGLRIALLIDFDNVILGVDDPPGFDVELVVNALRSRGSVVMGRAYGDWYRHNRHRRKLMEQGIELVETPVFGPLIKNSADIRIVLDGFEIAMQQSHIDTFCLVSGDSDFLPLIKKLQYLGKQVIVIAGTKFTSELVRRNCNEYISYENLLAESVGADEDATTLDGAFHLLQRTIANLHDRGMEVRSSTVKQMMVQLNPVFSERNFNCNQFKQFLDKGVNAGLIQLGRRDTSSGEYMVFLADEDMNGETPVVAEPATAKPARSRRTSRSRRDKDDTPKEEVTASAPEQSTPVAQSTPPEEKSETGDDETSNGELSPLRRGRLRFSGRSWKSGETRKAPPAEESTPAEATEEKVDASAANTSDTDSPADEQPSTETVKAETSEETAEPATEAAPAEEAQAEEETPAPKKRTTRGGRRRKSAAAESQTDEAEKSDSAQEISETETSEAAEETSTSEATSDEAAAETATEEKPKTTRRRRTPRKKAEDKTEEATSGDSEAQPAEEAQDAAEEMPKTTRRRRTPRKKAEDKTEE